LKDADPSLNRRAYWIEPPGFSRVHARIMGDENDPLVLYVHGSGPRNSSNQWSHIAMELSKISTQPYFHVAIDCPGYGLSEGRKQTVRSYPGDLLAAVVRALGRRSAACLVGSSQGAAAVLNALHEKPKLAFGALVLHPVTMAPEKFAKLNADITAVYDVDELGHPVSVGRRLRTIIPKCLYIEGSSKTDGPGFDIDLAPKHILELLRKCKESQVSNRSVEGGGGLVSTSKRKQYGVRDTKLPMLCSLHGGISAWSRVNNREWEALTGVALSDREGEEDEANETTKTKSNQSQQEEEIWRPHVDNKGAIKYVSLSTGRTVSIRPLGKVLIETLDTRAQTQGSGNKPCSDIITEKRRIRNLLFHSTRGSEVGMKEEDVTQDIEVQSSDVVEDYRSSEDEEERDMRKKNESEMKRQLLYSEESKQTMCMLCKQQLIYPTRFEDCRCIICVCCVEKSSFYTARCPCCDVKVKEMNKKITSAQKQQEEEEGDREEVKTIGQQNQLKLWKDLLRAKKSSKRVVLEYGNVSEVEGANRINFTTMVSIVKNKCDYSDPNKIIKKVDFNINPGYSKPTASINKPDRKGVFAFSYAMGREFPCVITVHFFEGVGLGPVNIDYTVQSAKQTHYRIVLDIPKNLSVERRPKQIEVPADPPRSVWISYKDTPSEAQVSEIGLKGISE